MIKLTLFNDADVIVNADLIECVECTPDTLISLTTGKKLMVKESVEEVIGRVVAFRRLISKSARLFGHKAKSSCLAETKGSDAWT